jgi:hypothetical protein
MTRPARTPMTLTLLSVLAALLLTAPSASAAPVGKDGKIHACYKWKGKKKGTLRVVRGAKVRCPKKWKKVSWYVKGPVGPPIGAPGPAGPQGEKGPAGTTDDAVVKQLEGKVSELLTRVEELEALLPTVQTLCTQVATLTSQVNAVESALGGLSLNAVLTTLGGVLDIPTLPGALPAFSCPTP